MFCYKKVQLIHKRVLCVKCLNQIQQDPVNRHIPRTDNYFSVIQMLVYREADLTFILTV